MADKGPKQGIVQPGKGVIFGGESFGEGAVVTNEHPQAKDLWAKYVRHGAIKEVSEDEALQAMETAPASSTPSTPATGTEAGTEAGTEGKDK